MKNLKKIRKLKMINKIKKITKKNYWKKKLKNFNSKKILKKL